jgi:hypothetical protein
MIEAAIIPPFQCGSSWRIAPFCGLEVAILLRKKRDRPQKGRETNADIVVLRERGIQSLQAAT